MKCGCVRVPKECEYHVSHYRLGRDGARITRKGFQTYLKRLKTCPIMIAMHVDVYVARATPTRLRP